MYSTSFGTEIDGREVQVLVPRVIGNTIVSQAQAERHFFKTHRHLGIFDTIAHARMYANRLHLQQAKLMRQR